jgi:hypothetical protein
VKEFFIKLAQGAALLAVISGIVGLLWQIGVIGNKIQKVVDKLDPVVTAKPSPVASPSLLPYVEIKNVASKK